MNGRNSGNVRMTNYTKYTFKKVWYTNQNLI